MDRKKVCKKSSAKKKMMSIKLKREIIEKHEQGVRVVDLSRQYGRSTSMICSVLKRKESIKSVTPAKGLTIISKLRTSLHENMEKLLMVWVTEKQLQGDTLTQTIICEKARAIYGDLLKQTPQTSIDEASEESFKASRGWFENFKKRSGIHSVVRHGEAASSDMKAAEDYIKTFSDLIKAQGYISQQLTLALCANASGDCKIKPLLVYHSENPRAFKSHKILKENCKLCGGRTRRHGSPGSSLWTLLILDNAPAHPPNLEDDILEELKFIKVLYLSPNTTPILQPMDQQSYREFTIGYTWLDLKKTAFFQTNEDKKIRDLLKKIVRIAMDGSALPYLQTISRRLVANGLHSCRPLRRLPLTPPNRRQRLEWCRARSTWMTEWYRVVFSDESRFCLSSDSRRVRVWRRRGERSNPAAIVERPTVRQRGIMVWGAIAYDSRSPLLRIQGNLTAQRYVDDVLRPVTLHYLQGVPNALYQQDNARPHTARISQQALQDVQMLPWPPYSPDLSPIEHVWDIIGRRLHALPQPRSEDELWQVVERE
ncbi:hypothetical protein LAZ67_X001268 [Cordylochernes scorpioides]|uniref:HTH CENPB-type domain-containing protein n=1 Tax=Cordylochernes scorpioides TaxID=51811 RepID=A0ABY6LUV6_9ARAC|nr:hypothetical protein LAZ67_X001268 [Cordylochernes scorpioides]